MGIANAYVNKIASRYFNSYTSAITRTYTRRRKLLSSTVHLKSLILDHIDSPPIMELASSVVIAIGLAPNAEVAAV